MLYRAVALTMFRFGGDPASEFEAVRACEGVAQVDPSDPELRSEVVGSIASRISAYPGVRAALLERQRDFAVAGVGRGARRARHRHGHRAGRHRQAVRHRLARSARPPARCRAAGARDAGASMTMCSSTFAPATRATRAASAPLAQAPDADLLDTSAMPIDEAIAAAIELVERKLAALA